MTTVKEKRRRAAREERGVKDVQTPTEEETEREETIGTPITEALPATATEETMTEEASERYAGMTDVPRGAQIAIVTEETIDTPIEIPPVTTTEEMTDTQTETLTVTAIEETIDTLTGNHVSTIDATTEEMTADMAEKREATAVMLQIPVLPVVEETEMAEGTTISVTLIHQETEDSPLTIGITIHPEHIDPVGMKKSVASIEEKEEVETKKRSPVQSHMATIPSWKTKIEKAPQPSGSRVKSAIKTKTETDRNSPQKTRGILMTIFLWILPVPYSLPGLPRPIGRGATWRSDD